jgi:hypothetical protein
MRGLSHLPLELSAQSCGLREPDFDQLCHLMRSLSRVARLRWRLLGQSERDPMVMILPLSCAQKNTNSSQWFRTPPLHNPSRGPLLELLNHCLPINTSPSLLQHSLDLLWPKHHRTSTQMAGRGREHHVCDP